MERPFYIDDLRPGMVLAKNVMDPKTGSLILPANTALYPKAIDFMKRHDIEDVEIEISERELLQYSWDNDVVPTIETSITNRTKKSIQPKVHGKKAEVNVSEIINNSELIKSRIIANLANEKSKLAYKLTDYKRKKLNQEQLDQIKEGKYNEVLERASEKSVRVAIFATAVANRYNQTVSPSETIDLNTIATAALLHNIGSVAIIDEVRESLRYVELGPKYGLTKDKIKELKVHYDPKYNSYYSFILMNEDEILKSKSVLKAMMLNSNENRKGNGPLKSKVLSKDKQAYIMGSLIISLCSEYDNVLTHNIRQHNTLENVSAFLQNCVEMGLYDAELINHFMHAIPLYPVGCKVKLAGNSKLNYAIVTQNYNEFDKYHRPQVLIIPEEITLDLSSSECTTITIDSVVGNEVHLSKLCADEINKIQIKRAV